jgi:hypothetical protein
MQLGTGALQYLGKVRQVDEQDSIDRVSVVLIIYNVTSAVVFHCWVLINSFIPGGLKNAKLALGSKEESCLIVLNPRLPTGLASYRM